MRFAQFYQMSVALKGKPSQPIEACGDRAVVLLDGRNSVAVSAAFAKRECQKRKYIGFSIHEGESFNRARVVRKMEKI